MILRISLLVRSLSGECPPNQDVQLGGRVIAELGQDSVSFGHFLFHKNIECVIDS